jgi:CBS-domain-containing membrane protein
VKAFQPNFEHIFPVFLTTPIEKLMDMFNLGVHRVVILDKTDKIQNLISQTDLLNVLVQTIPLLG